MLQEAKCLVTTAQACHINKSQWGVDNTHCESLFVMTLRSSQLNANVLLVKLRNVNLLRSENRQNAQLQSRHLRQGPETQVYEAQHFHGLLPFTVSSGWDSSKGLG